MNNETISDLHDDACELCGAPAVLLTRTMTVESSIGVTGACAPCWGRHKKQGGMGPREWQAKVLRQKARA